MGGSRPGQWVRGQGDGQDQHRGTQDPHLEGAVTDPSGKDDNADDSCVEKHGNEEWIGDYEKISETNEWSEDVSDKDISDNT